MKWVSFNGQIDLTAKEITGSESDGAPPKPLFMVVLNFVRLTVLIQEEKKRLKLQSNSYHCPTVNPLSS